MCFTKDCNKDVQEYKCPTRDRDVSIGNFLQYYNEHFAVIVPSPFVWSSRLSVVTYDRINQLVIPYVEVFHNFGMTM